jgi:hypothetical protein
MKTAFSLLVIAFFALIIFCKIHAELSYRYRITVPDGRYSTSYYTDSYIKRNGCVRFRRFATATDSTEVCGMYTISQLR